MQYIFDGVYHKIARITGPQHNFLGIKLSQSPGKITMCDLSTNKCCSSTLEREIKEQVLEGLNQINTELETKYCVEIIQYVGDDTLCESVYTELIKEIVLRVECNKNTG